MTHSTSQELTMVSCDKLYRQQIATYHIAKHNLLAKEICHCLQQGLEELYHLGYREQLNLLETKGKKTRKPS